MEFAFARQRLCRCPAVRLEKEFENLKSQIVISSRAYRLAATFAISSTDAPQCDCRPPARSRAFLQCEHLTTLGLANIDSLLYYWK